MNQYVMLATMKQMHIVSGLEKDFQQKQNGKKPPVGMKKHQEKTIYPWGNEQPSEEKCNIT